MLFCAVRIIASQRDEDEREVGREKIRGRRRRAKERKAYVTSFISCPFSVSSPSSRLEFVSAETLLTVTRVGEEDTTGILPYER